MLLFAYIALSLSGTRLATRNYIDRLVERRCATKKVNVGISVHLWDKGEDENIALLVDVPNPMPDSIYVKVSDVLDIIKEKHADYVNDDCFLYSSDARGYVKVSTINSNQLPVGYFSDGKASGSHTYKNIVYQFSDAGDSYSIYFNCDGDEELISISHFFPSFFIGDTHVVFDEKVNTNGDNCYDKIIKNDLGEGQEIIHSSRSRAWFSIYFKEFDWSLVKYKVVGSMSEMFCDLNNLGKKIEIDLSYADTSQVTDMRMMFYASTAIEAINFSGIDTSKVTDMNGMFIGVDVTTLDLSSFDTYKVTDMSWMFNACGNLEILDISSFDMSNVNFIGNMFGGCDKLRIIYATKATFAKIRDNAEAKLPSGPWTETEVIWKVAGTDPTNPDWETKISIYKYEREINT